MPSRIWALARHNAVLIGREPGPAISRLLMPLVVISLLRPLYLAADPLGGTARAVAGGLVLFSLLAMSLVGTSIVVERGWHTLDRLRATPARPLEILCGKAAPVLGLLVAQQGLIVGYGVVVFGLRVARPGLLAAVVLAWAATLLCLGAAVGVLVRGPGQLSASVDIATMVLGGVAGALVPLAALPGWARAVAPASPGYWALGAMRAALDGDAGPAWRGVAVLALFGAGGAAVTALGLHPRSRRLRDRLGP